jgi:polysaccharide export outer membrane protein
MTRYISTLTSVIFLFLALSLDSCISKRKLTYFTSPPIDTIRDKKLNNQNPGYRLQPRDVLSIRIKTLDEKTSNYFNAFPPSQVQQINNAALYMNGHSVDVDGNVTLSEVGKINVVNLTIYEAQEKIQKRVNEFLSNATILVKLVSFKITVLGEVANPGHFYVYNDQATVLEALGMAGDLTDYGQRDNITLVRQVEGGSVVKVLNLKSKNLIASPYYYMMPNDVLYVQPLKAKLDRGNLGTLNLLSILFGAISTAILLLNYTKK